MPAGVHPNPSSTGVHASSATQSCKRGSQGSTGPGPVPVTPTPDVPVSAGVSVVAAVVTGVVVPAVSVAEPLPVVSSATVVLEDSLGATQSMLRHTNPLRH